MRIQSSHSDSDRGLDAYFTPPEAIISLIHIENEHIPKYIWEPAAGNGAIVKPLLNAGYEVVASDIFDYGEKYLTFDYLQAKMIIPGIKAIITNPPYKLAVEFAQKALTEVPYLALLLRTNFLEFEKRLSFFRNTPPGRIWISSRRLPMMHRHNWTGPTAPSNTCFAWFIWDKLELKSLSRDVTIINWFDWKEICPSETKPDFHDLLFIEEDEE